MAEGPRIYNLFPLLAGPLPRWQPHLARARAMGFTWVFVNAFHAAGFSGSLYAVKDYYAIDPRLLNGAASPFDQLRAMLAAASRLGLAVMMDLVINHTAFDSPLVSDHPTWFVRGTDGGIVHPGARDGKERVVWRDLAQVDNAHSTDREALWAYWRDVALHYAGMGFRGFRCDAAYQVPADLWRYLIGAVKARHPEVIFVAETLGCTPEETLATAAAGFDFIFNSSKWWDFRAPWCLEQYHLTAPVVPSISFPETHDTPRLAGELGGDRAAVLQRYAFAALFSAGVMMPVGFEYGFRRRLHVVRTTPADWETPLWDLTASIAAIHRIKAAHGPLNEEGPLEVVPVDDDRVLAFRKWTRDRSRWVLVALNRERTVPAGLRLPAGVGEGAALAVGDPGGASPRPVREGERLALAPAGILVVHPAGGLPGVAGPAREASMERQARVLVVDDDAEMRSLLLDELRDEGYQVAEAKDGAEAVLAVRKCNFDVILMDKNMPGPSGLDLLPGFRRICPHSRIIMITAFGDVSSYMEAVEKGAVEFLFKPFRMEEMKAAVRKALEGDAAARS